MSDDAAETAGREADEEADAAGDAEAEAPDGRPADDEEAAVEETTDGEVADEESADEKSVDGEVADEKSADGEVADEVTDVVSRVAEHDEALADEVRALRDDLSAAEERVAELESKLKRKAADFENYKKRAERRREELEERATEDLVERLVSVRDNLVRALDQDEDADIRDGVASTLEEFDRVLGEENVDPVEPDPGEGVDPHRHEVLMRVESDHPEGTVVDVYRPGYVMADRVLQTAQVTVSEGPADEGTTE